MAQFVATSLPRATLSRQDPVSWTVIKAVYKGVNWWYNGGMRTDQVVMLRLFGRKVGGFMWSLPKGLVSVAEACCDPDDTVPGLSQVQVVRDRVQFRLRAELEAIAGDWTLMGLSAARADRKNLRNLLLTLSHQSFSLGEDLNSVRVEEMAWMQGALNSDDWCGGIPLLG